MPDFRTVPLECPHCLAESPVIVAGWNPSHTVHSGYECPLCRRDIEVDLPGRAIWAGCSLTPDEAAQRLRFLESVDAAIRRGRTAMR